MSGQEEASNGDTGAAKILVLSELAERLRSLKAQGKKVVLCHGVFDLLHPGHVRHLQAARRLGDVLAVTITRDEFVNKGPGRPYFTQHLRAESVAALSCVDYVALNQWATAERTIALLQPDLFVKGSEFAEGANDLLGTLPGEQEATRSIGGEMVFTDEVTFSSSELLNQFFAVYPEDARSYVQRMREQYSVGDVIQRIKGVSDLRPLVVGETIIDEYHYCEPFDTSPTDGVVETRFIRSVSSLGGVLATANHLAQFCREVHVVTCLGLQESHEEFIRSNLAPNVHPVFFYRADAPTIVKRRFLREPTLQKMLEVWMLNPDPVPGQVRGEIAAFLAREARNYDLVIVNDYGHGFFEPPLVEATCQHARFLALNAQTNLGNFGYNLVTKYPRADYVCIDELEAALAVGRRGADLEQVARHLADRLQAQRVTITRGHRGSLGYAAGEGFFPTPVLSTRVVDRVGAGDAYLAVTAPLVALGAPMDVVGLVGNAAGALAVLIVGNERPVEQVALVRFLTALMK